MISLSLSYIDAHTHIHNTHRRTRGALGVMVSVVRKGLRDASSNPERECLYFSELKYPWENYNSDYPPYRCGFGFFG